MVISRSVQYPNSNINNSNGSNDDVIILYNTWVLKVKPVVPSYWCEVISVAGDFFRITSVEEMGEISTDNYLVFTSYITEILCSQWDMNHQRLFPTLFQSGLSFCISPVGSLYFQFCRSIGCQPFYLLGLGEQKPSFPLSCRLSFLIKAFNHIFRGRDVGSTQTKFLPLQRDPSYWRNYQGLALSQHCSQGLTMPHTRSVLCGGGTTTSHPSQVRLCSSLYLRDFMRNTEVRDS